jgi:prepilin-type N-terminal cleavage/methylation domain-containing protein
MSLTMRANALAGLWPARQEKATDVRGEQMTTAARPRAEGFSLIELVIAMAVTLVISGAMYGLLAGGQSAFRREPELTDRQQNIRMAMSVVQKDLDTAGVGMGAFFQVFADGLNAPAAAPQGTTARTDHLHFYGNDGSCPDVDALQAEDCNGSKCPTNGLNLNTRSPIPGCYQENSLLLIIYARNGLDLGAKWGLGFNFHSGDDKVNFPGGQQPTKSQIQDKDDLECFVKNSPPASCDRPVRMSPLTMFRYEVANDPDGVPCLWRSTTGGMNPGAGGYVPAPAAGGMWQLIARGIEDFQVQYRTGAGWLDDPGIPADPNFNSIVREVRVTMSARAMGQNLTGQTTAINAAMPAGTRNAVRGTLTSTNAIRATLYYMSQAGQWQ